MADTVNKTIEQIIFEGHDRITAVSKAGEQAIKSMRQALDGVRSTLEAVGVTVGVGALINLHYQALQATADLQNLNQQTGASVEGLSAMQRVAQVGNHDFEGFTQQLGKTLRALKEGGEEGNKATRAFQFLGIETRDANGRFRDMGEVVPELARKLAKYADDGDKAVLVQDALGKGAERYLPLLNDIAEGTDYQSTVTAEMAAKADEAEKNIRRLNVAMGDARRELVNDLTPAIIEFTNRAIVAKDVTGNLAAGIVMAFTAETKDIPGRIKEIDAELERLDAIMAKPRLLPSLGLGDSAVGVKIGRLVQERELLERLRTQRLGSLTKGMVQDASGEFIPEPAKPRIGYVGETDKDRAREQQAAELAAKAIADAQEQSATESREAWEAYYKFLRTTGTDVTHELEIDDEGKIRSIREVAHTSGDYLNDVRDQMDAAQEQLRVYDEETQAGADAAVNEDQKRKALRIQTLRDAIETEAEEEERAYEERLLLLQQASDAELEALGGRQAVEQQMEFDHAARLYAIRKRSLDQLGALTRVGWQYQAQTVLGFVTEMTAGVTQQSRLLFEINKIATLATIALKTPEAVASAFAFGSKIGGPVAGAAMAALAAAAMAAQFAQAASVQFGAGSAPSVSGTPAPPVTPVGGQEEQRRGTVILDMGGIDEEQLFSGKRVRELGKRIAGLSRDGFVVVAE